jgi:hypothetical protein
MGMRREFMSHVVGVVLGGFCRAVKRKFGGADFDLLNLRAISFNHDYHGNRERCLKLSSACSIYYNVVAPAHSLSAAVPLSAHGSIANHPERFPIRRPQPP